MSVKVCNSPHAEGYDPNSSSNSQDVTAAHVASHEVSFVGAVLRLRERNAYDDSDFYALVWDEEEQRTREVQYATTRGWTYHNSADIDATREVIAKAVAYETGVRFAEAQRLHAETPRMGDTARAVVKGVGVQGVIAWVGKDRNRYSDIARYGIKVEGRKGYVFRSSVDDDFSFDAETVSAEDMVEWRAGCEHSARVSFSQALAIADQRDPLPGPGAVVDSLEADEDGWRLYALGEDFAEQAHCVAVAQRVVDGGAPVYLVEGVRGSGTVIGKYELAVVGVLGRVAHYARVEGVRVLHDGRGAVRVERPDGGRLVMRPVVGVASLVG